MFDRREVKPYAATPLCESAISALSLTLQSPALTDLQRDALTNCIEVVQDFLGDQKPYALTSVKAVFSMYEKILRKKGGESDLDIAVRRQVEVLGNEFWRVR